YPHPAAGQRHGHRSQDEQDRERHDQLYKRKTSFVSAFHWTAIVSCGLPAAIGCPCEFRIERPGRLTTVSPRVRVWKFSVTSAPPPLTPGVPGWRFNWTVAVPVSFMMFFVNTGCCPSLARKSPRTMSFSRSTFGSNWIVNGAEAASVTFSIMRVAVNW